MAVPTCVQTACTRLRAPICSPIMGRKGKNRSPFCKTCMSKRLRVAERTREGKAKTWECLNCGKRESVSPDLSAGSFVDRVDRSRLRVGGTKSVENAWRVKGPVSKVVIRYVDEERDPPPRR